MPTPLHPPCARCADDPCIFVRRRGRWVLLAASTLGLAVVVGVRSRAVRRFVVADHSMEPTLVAGQGLVGLRRRRARVGELRTFEHPDRSGFWLVKRVTAVSSDSMIVESDNRAVATEDSRSFGPVDVEGSYRIVVRIPLRWM